MQRPFPKGLPRRFRLLTCGTSERTCHTNLRSKVQYCTHADARSAATARQVEIAHVNATWYQKVCRHCWLVARLKYDAGGPRKLRQSQRRRNPCWKQTQWACNVPAPALGQGPALSLRLKIVPLMTSWYHKYLPLI